MERPLSLVTGACGFMGTHMCEVLAEAGHRIRATDLPAAHEKDDRAKGRFPSVIDRLGVEFVPGDFTRPGDLAALVRDVDYVFHVAGVFSYSAPWALLRQVNESGTEALIDAGVHMGFSRRIAQELVYQTMEGSVAIARASGTHPTELRNQVTSPGGTTAAALYQLEKGGFRTVISKAIWAAYQRSKALGELADK
jgi:nucleoside-diphosphate-sugar epimerase